MPDSVAILEIGSSKISALCGSNGKNSAIVSGLSEIEYAGYYEGEFLEENLLKSVFSSCITNLETQVGQTITKLYVGVPADFSICVNKTVSKNYGQRVKITKDDLNEIYINANTLQNNENYVLISCSAIEYVLDDGRKTCDILGQKTSKITAQISLIYAEVTFIKKINELLKGIGIGTVEYLSTPLVEAQFLLDSKRREDMAIIVDCGYIATSVAVVKGNGLLNLKSFSVGGAHVSADLSECLNLAFNEAEQLKKQVILSVVPSEKEDYEILRNESVVPVSMIKTNEIVSSRLDMIASLICKCLQENLSIIKDVPFYLTGGGISYIKGARDYLSKILNTYVTIIAPNDINMAKPTYSQMLALLNCALNQQQSQKSLFQALFNKLRRR